MKTTGLILAGASLLCTLLVQPVNGQDRARESGIEYSGMRSLTVHWVKAVMDQGRTVLLEDGSIWRICPTCAAIVSRWSPGSLVSVFERGNTYSYPYKLSATISGCLVASAKAVCVKN